MVEGFGQVLMASTSPSSIWILVGQFHNQLKRWLMEGALPSLKEEMVFVEPEPPPGIRSGCWPTHWTCPSVHSVQLGSQRLSSTCPPHVSRQGYMHSWDPTWWKFWLAKLLQMRERGYHDHGTGSVDRGRRRNWCGIHQFLEWINICWVDVGMVWSSVTVNQTQRHRDCFGNSDSESVSN